MGLMCALIGLPAAVGAFLLFLHKKSPRLLHLLYLAAVGVAFLGAAALLIQAFQGTAPRGSFYGISELPFTLDASGFRALYAAIAAALWLVTGIYSKEYFGDGRALARYYAFSLLTLAATLGVFFSDDLLTCFLFFELMSLSSYALVAHEESPGALRAAGTYLAVAVICGMILLLGIFFLYHTCGTLVWREMAEPFAALSPARRYTIGGLLLIGFGAKAGVFPLHIWLPKAHPVAPAPASALLSGVLTKTGVLGIIQMGGNLFYQDAGWGMLLLGLAAVTMVWGAVLALCATDFKRTLACSSVSQIGFILVGVACQSLLGSHRATAVWGTALHMINHSVVKLILFIAAGVIYRRLHTLDLNGLRGFGRKKPFFMVVFSVAALSLAGLPGTLGYVSKTLLHEGLLEALALMPAGAPAVLVRGVEVAFLATGGLTLAYMLKLFFALLTGHRSGQHEEEAGRWMTRKSALCWALAALPLILCGCVPQLAETVATFSQAFFDSGAPDHSVHYFTWHALSGAVVSVVVATAVYRIVVRGLLSVKTPDGRRYRTVDGSKLDLEDRVYRPAGRGMQAAGTFVARVAEGLVDGPLRLFLRTALKPSGPGRFPGKFLSRFHEIFSPNAESAKKARVPAAAFTRALLLMALGLAVLAVVAIVWAR